jgi:hypothetical protein
MNNRIEEIKKEFSGKSIEELRAISSDGGKNYSPEATLAANDLLKERDPSFDKIDRILHSQQKSEKSVTEMERKVGCIFQFVVFQVVFMVIGVILGLLKAGG